MDLGIDGDAALVTSAASGLGFASANALAAEGADVAICGRHERDPEAVRADLESAGDGDVLVRGIDPTDPDDLAAAVETTVESFGGLDHLVTATVGAARTGFLETTERRWYEAYDALVMSAVWTIENAHPHLLESDDGSIVCLTSRTRGAVGDDPVLANALSRAVDGLVETVAREFAPEIRANAVMAGAIETPRTEEAVDALVDRGEARNRQDARERLAREVPLERLGDPAEVGSVVALLSSPRGAYVTGAEVAVDGGLTRS